jgi:hypothetical protein
MHALFTTFAGNVAVISFSLLIKPRSLSLRGPVLTPPDDPQNYVPYVLFFIMIPLNL